MPQARQARTSQTHKPAQATYKRGQAARQIPIHFGPICAFVPKTSGIQVSPELLLDWQDIGKQFQAV